MGDVRRTDFNFPIINLTNNNACNSNAANRVVDFIRHDGRDANQRTELNNENIQGPHSNAPVIDLTQNNDQFLNDGIPFIDLTQDDEQFLNNGIPFIDLTEDNDQFLSNGTPFIDLTLDDDQFLNNGIPDTDLTQENDQFLNNRISVIDLTDDSVNDIAAQIQCIDLTDNEVSNNNHTNQYISSINDAHINASRELIYLTEDNNEDSNTDIPVVDLSNANDQSRNSRISISGIDRNISSIDTSCQEYNNDRPVIGLMQKVNKGIRNPADIELNNDEVMSLNNFPVCLKNTVSESNFRIPTDNFYDDVIENNVLKYNETFDNNLMALGTSRRMQQCYHKEEIVRPNPLLRNSYEEKKSSPRRSEKIYQKTASNFLKPAGHPIPLRHSLGRSTVNTSKNIPIEFIEDAEGHSHTLTVASIVRRKKSKSCEDISKKNIPNSSEPSTSKEKTFSFDDSKDFFQKLWSLFYWIFKIIILRFIEFYSK